MSSVDRGETIENAEDDVRESKEESGSAADDQKQDDDDDDQTDGAPVPTAPPAELIEDS